MSTGLLSQFLVVEAAGATVNPLPVILQWSNLDITGVRTIDLEIDIASINASTFEADDFLRLEFSVDGGAYRPVLEARANESGKMALDTDFNGVGDGGQFDFVLAGQKQSALVDGTSLDVRLSISVDDMDEDFAVDELFIAKAPISDWTAPAPFRSGGASYFDAMNWSTLLVPSVVDDVAIRNGGIATSAGAASGDPSTADVLSLTIGDSLGSGSLIFSGVELSTDRALIVGGQGSSEAPAGGTFAGTSGTLEVRDAPFFTVNQSTDVGKVWSRGTASVSARGDLVLERLVRVSIGGQLDVGGARAEAFATADSQATVMVRDVNEVSIAGDLDLCDSDVLGPPAGLATATCEVDVTFEEVIEMNILDLEVGNPVADRNESITSDSTIELIDVRLLTVADDIELISGAADSDGATPSMNDLTGRISMLRTTTMLTDDLTVGDLTLPAEDVAEVHALFELVFSNLVAAAGSVGVVGSLQGGAVGTDLDAELRLVSSTLEFDGSLTVGDGATAPVGALDAVMALDEGSTATITALAIGDEGRLRLHLDGPAALSGFGPAPGSASREGEVTYSAIAVGDATLGGTVTAIFDFLPSAGTWTFDLVEAASAGALADTSAMLTVEGLDGGFTVDSFGVVSDPVDILRLVISGAPLPTDLVASLDNGVTEVLPGDTVVYTATISNNGPEGEVGALVTSGLSPDLESCSWTSAASGGASSIGSGSGQTLFDVVDLPAGSQVAYTITCSVTASASGLLEVAVEINGSRPDSAPSNNLAADLDNIIEPVDLSITLDDGVSSAMAGDTLIYEIQVSNLGTRATSGTVSDVFPPELTMCSWSCSPAPGSQCATGTVNGDLLDTVTLPVGGAVLYTATCVVDPALPPSTLAITNSASVAAPAGSLDLVPENNTAQDINAGPAVLILRDDFEAGDFSAWTLVAP